MLNGAPTLANHGSVEAPGSFVTSTARRPCPPGGIVGRKTTATWYSSESLAEPKRVSHEALPPPPGPFRVGRKQRPGMSPTAIFCLIQGGASGL